MQVVTSIKELEDYKDKFGIAEYNILQRFLYLGLVIEIETSEGSALATACNPFNLTSNFTTITPIYPYKNIRVKFSV